MVKTCCVCSSSTKKTPNKSFHRFPQNENTKAEWIRSLEIKHKITYNYVVCGDHFKTTDFDASFRGNKRMLKKTSIPTRKKPLNVNKMPESTQHDEEAYPEIEFIDLSVPIIQGSNCSDVAVFGHVRTIPHKLITASRPDVQLKGVQILLPKSKTSPDPLSNN